MLKQIFNVFKRKAASQRGYRHRGGRNPGKRSFEAALSDRLNGDWGTWPANINEALKGNHDLLRSRSRHLARNSEHGNRFVGLITSNVIGEAGIQLQSKAIFASGKTHSQAAMGIEAAFARWAEDCEITGQHHLIDLETLLMAAWAKDGEFFLQTIEGGKKAGPFGFKVALINAERVDSNYSVDLGNGKQILMGVELNADGRPVAYHIKDDNNQSAYLADSGRRYIRIPAAQMIHGFITEEVGQVRGIPPMTSAMIGLRNLSEYEKSALVNARIGAATMGFFTSETGDVDFTGDEMADDGPVFEVEPGIFKQLPPGMKLETFNTQYPSNEFGTFVKARLRGAAAGLGVAYHGLTGDLESVNFSTGRIGELRDREFFKALQGWFVRKAIVPVFRRWLFQALLHGQISTPSGQPLLAMNASLFTPARFRCKRWPWVDPLKDIQAAALAIKLSLRSRSSIISELGDDAEEVWREIERELKAMEKRSVPIYTELAPTETPEAEPEMVPAKAVEDGEE